VSSGSTEGLLGRARRLVRGTPLEGPSRSLARGLRRVLSGAPPAAPPEASDPTPPMFVPPGHFYSPVPSVADIDAHRDRMQGPRPASLEAIDLRLTEQASLLDAFKPFYDEQPFPADRSGDTRYWFENHSFGYGDALALYCMLRFLEPARVIEVGSGWSSCVLLDTCERFLGWGPQITMIEPYPGQLHELLRPDDASRFRLLDQPIQQVPLDVFRALEAGDVLFIDSTHVARVESDVNHEIFEVLPALAAGVYVHFHDIFYPFEYPIDWVEEGRGWNEAYVLRAFLEYNQNFEIVFFNDLVHQRVPDRFFQDFPLWSRNPGASLWLRKVR
jgi:Methyltransferase domain